MTDERRPDVEIAARVNGRKLRFEVRPTVDVEFAGDVAGEESGSERRNQPDEVEPGVTYRDVEVSWHARARLDPRVDERLG